MSSTAPLVIRQPYGRVHVTQGAASDRRVSFTGNTRKIEVRPTAHSVSVKPRTNRISVLNDLSGIAQSLNERIRQVIEDGGRQTLIAPLTTGNGQDYILRSFGAPILTLYDGLGVWLTPNLSNGEPPITLQVDATPAKPVLLATRDGVSPLPVDTLRQGTPIIVFYSANEDAWIAGTSMAELTQPQRDFLETSLAQTLSASSLAEAAKADAQAASDFGQQYRDQAEAARAEAEDFRDQSAQARTGADNARDEALSFRDQALAAVDGAGPVVQQAITEWANDTQSAFGVLSANLANNYYTINAADQAISGQLTQLQSTLEGQIASGDTAVQDQLATLNATLTNDYYTATAADGAIAQALSDWSADANSPFGQLSSNLSTNYYTRTSTDAAIAGAVTSLETSLTNDLSTIQATLTQDYYTKTTTDSVIAAAIQQFDAGAANVTSVLSAVSDIKGYAEATAGFRVQADGSVSLLDLVAYSDGGVSYSLAKLSADDIILDGSVTAPKLDVNELSAITSDIGTVTAGKVQSSDGKFVIDLNNKKISITV